MSTDLCCSVEGDAKMTALLAALFGLAVLCLPASSASAQDMSFSLDETSKEEEAQAEGDEGSEGAEASAEGDIIGDLAAGGDADLQKSSPAAPRAKEEAEEIYAVQQIYALRLNRFELAPSAAFTLNDPYVAHPAIGVAMNYWWTNVLAVGANLLWYQGFDAESDLNFYVRRSTRLAVPITEYQFGANLNFTYVPFYGKFAMFNKYIFQWDSYLIGGVGLMRTRPVPVIDPEVRDFDWGMRLAFNLGIGIRVFVTRWLAVFGEFRDYAFLERNENLEVALGTDRFDPSTWEADSPTFTQNVTAQIGVTLFFPFKFEYRQPK
ncbi:MAG: outer membrane beta-barrel domain-containing protein [Polyangiales bacterium]